MPGSTIRLGFSGFPGPFNPERIRRLLEQRFELALDQDRPDYLIYSVFSQEFLTHPGAVRIFFTGENVRPDFNLCDYAFGYDWLEFGDRYLRCPNYQLYDQFKHLCQRRRSRPADIPSERRFCNFIYTNGFADPFRDEFFHRLAGYRRVDSPGAHLRNTQEPIGEAYRGDWSAPKVQYQRSFKFSFAFENSSSPGYTTEKIVHALAADTIPIYWGNPDIGREFNPRRIVNCHEFATAEAVIARIAAIDQDDGLYREILAQPFFPDDVVPAALQDAHILKRFESIFAQPKAQAIRRNRQAWGQRYEAERRRCAEAAEFLGGRDPLARAGRCLWRLRRALRRFQSHRREENVATAWPAAI